MLTRCHVIILAMIKKLTPEQVWIMFTSCLSIMLITSPDADVTRFGFIVGLAGQPAWLRATFRDRQPGMLFVSFVFTYHYLRGLFPALPGLF